MSSSLSFLIERLCSSFFKLESEYIKKNKLKIAYTIIVIDDLKRLANIRNNINVKTKIIEGKMNTKISHTNTELNKTGDNSNLGNLLADYTFQGADDWAKKNNIPYKTVSIKE